MQKRKKAWSLMLKVVFLCASAVASTSILLQSKSEYFLTEWGTPLEN